MTALIIVPCEPTHLHQQYPGQNNVQGTFVELDLETGRMEASYNPEIGNAVPVAVWHDRVLRFDLSGPLRGAVATELLHDLAPDAQIVLDRAEIDWDGNNHVGKLDEVGAAASARMEKIIAQYGGDGDEIYSVDADECFDADEKAEFVERFRSYAQTLIQGSDGHLTDRELQMENAPAYQAILDEFHDDDDETGKEESPVIEGFQDFLADCWLQALTICRPLYLEAYAKTIPQPRTEAPELSYALPQRGEGVKKLVVITPVKDDGMVELHRGGCYYLPNARWMPSDWNRYVFDNLKEMFDALLDTGDPDDPGYSCDQFKFLSCCDLEEPAIVQLFHNYLAEEVN